MLRLRRLFPLVAFSIRKSELIFLLGKLAKIRLTSKQKSILNDLQSLEEKIPVTQFVLNISQSLECSKTTIWNNLKQLKEIGLINYGNSKNKGSPITLTKGGKLILKELKGGEMT
jgi:Fe2+ or Zn2+ uptake regulation protein